MAASCTVERAAWNWRTWNDGADVAAPIQCLSLIMLSRSIDKKIQIRSALILC